MQIRFKVHDDALNDDPAVHAYLDALSDDVVAGRAVMEVRPHMTNRDLVEVKLFYDREASEPPKVMAGITQRQSDPYACNGIELLSIYCVQYGDQELF